MHIIQAVNIQTYSKYVGLQQEEHTTPFDSQPWYGDPVPNDIPYGMTNAKVEQSSNFEHKMKTHRPDIWHVIGVFRIGMCNNRIWLHKYLDQ